MNIDEKYSSRWNALKEGWRRIRKWMRAATPFILGVLATFFGLVLYNSVNPGPQPLSQRDVKNTVNEVLASATPPPAYSSQVYKIIQPSLVLIQTRETHENSDTDYGLGSGVIIDDQGDILTSRHVIEGATDLILTFFDGSESGAIKVAEMPEKDIAVLQAIEPPALLVPAVLGNPNAMRVGDEAYAVGNPFGLYSSMSAGVISGFDRVFKLPESNIEIPGMIQFDAAVNPGNSGGPLLNRSGYVIGIVTGIVNPTKENFFVGIGFAVPIDTAVTAIGAAPPY
jgi:S1-C subfamily serine protease